MATEIPRSGAWWKARLLLNTSLFFSLLAMCSPYGPRDWRYSYGTYHSVFQTILSCLAFLALIGVALDTIAPRLGRTHTGWPYMLATFALTSQATYVVFEPGILVLARISQLLIYFAAAVIAAGGWYLRKLNVRLGYEAPPPTRVTPQPRPEEPARPVMQPPRQERRPPL